MFGRKKITQVATQVSPLFEEENYESDWKKEALIQAILSNGDIPGFLVDGMSSSTESRVRRFYNWTKENYIYGLAEGTVESNTTNTEAMKGVLTARVGTPVTIEYCFMGEINNVHVGLEKLELEFDYDFTTNEIKKWSNEKGTPVYLKEVLSVHPNDDDIVPQYDPTGGEVRRGRDNYTSRFFNEELLGFKRDVGVIIDPTRTTEGIRVIAAYSEEIPSEIPDGEPTYKEHLIEYTWDIGSYSTEEIYHQVMYSYRASGKTRYSWWTYLDGAGEYPELDDLIEVLYRNPGTYFPFLFFRMEKKDLTDESLRDGRAYQDTKKAMSILGLDYDGLSASIHESPDIGDIQQAALMFGIPMNTKRQEGLKYLFEFFRRQSVTKDSAVRVLPGRNAPSQAIVIQDSNFKLGLGYNQITWEKFAGRIGEPGEVTSEESTTPLPVFSERIEYVGEGEYTVVSEIVETDVHAWVYKRQINDVFYEEVVVSGASLTFYISGRYGTVAKADNDNLLIPLDMRVCESLPRRDQEPLFMQAMNFVFNAKTTTKLKWYQSSLFKVVILVAAIVIAVKTGRAEIAKWAAAFTAGGITALAFAVMITILEVAAFKVIFDQVVKEIGIEAALILAAVFFLVGGYQAFSHGGLDNAPWASELLQASTGLVDGVGNYYQELAGKYNGELHSFNLMAEEKWKELEEAQELLDTQSLIDPFTFLGKRPVTILGESPDSFYARTIHAGNIGTIAFDAIEHHVDNALRLPKLPEALGGFNDPRF